MERVNAVIEGDTCYCEKLAVHSTYPGTGPNAGRKMSRCPFWPDGCGYMFWIDDPLEPRSAAVLTEMTKEMSDLIWEHYFTKEKIREKHDEEFERLKGKNKGEEKCYCDKVVVSRVWRDNGPDAGRRMMQCPDGPNGCGYIFWLEDRHESRAAEVISKLSNEISDLKWSQAVEVTNMETKHAEKLKKMKKTMRGHGSRWDDEN
ncbi:hypothetical protein ACET3Z_021860 [Daucus carota]